jgi:6-phosphogluconolactonase (cycloisomerase 2 family)
MARVSSGVLYIGSYTQNAEDGCGHVPGDRGEGLVAVRVQSAVMGAPCRVEAQPTLVNPTYLAVDSARGVLYAVEESATTVGESGVCSFKLKNNEEANTPAEFIERRFGDLIGGKSGCHLMLWPPIDPSVLLVSCYNGPFCALQLNQQQPHHHSVELTGLGGPFPGSNTARYDLLLPTYCLLLPPSHYWT